MLQLTSLNLKNENLLQGWLDSDSSKELQSYKNFSVWFSLLSPKKRWAWTVEEDNKQIGFVDLEKTDNIGYFSFYIAPTERNKGKSKEILLLLVQKAKELNISMLEAGVNENNLPSQKSLESIGFIQNGRDKDGYLIYTLPINSSKRI